MKPVLIVLLSACMSQAAEYSAQRVTVDNIPVVRLTDSAHKTEVSIVPSIGNTAYDMKVNGKAVFWSPYQSLAEFKAKPVLLGNPLLAPWANRLDTDAFYANGKRYLLNDGLHNYRRDGNGKPIHGLLTQAGEWEVTNVKADDSSAEVTSRLEFWRYPDYLAQFPFAHNLEMTYRLRDGVLEVVTSIENLSRSPMPVGIGFHPYFTLHDAPRDAWQVQIPAKEHVTLSPLLIPTGAKTPNTLARPLSLQGQQLDDVFTTIERDSQGRAEFSVQGKSEKIAVVYGPKYPVAVIYAPPGKDFICFEPMTGVTNAFNLAHEGKYNELQTVAPGQKWQESYWIRPTGF